MAAVFCFLGNHALSSLTGILNERKKWQTWANNVLGTLLGPVVRKPVIASPGLNVNQGS